MRKKIIYALAAICLSLGAALTLTASSMPVESPETIAIAEVKDAVVEDPGTLEEFGPPGVLISTVLGGIVLIIRNINEGKRIDVQLYKDRAAEAENRSNTEIGKAQKRVEDIEKRIDQIISDRDAYRTTLEQKKAYFSQQLLDLERRHQEAILGTHETLTTQLAVRYELEKILIGHGIHTRIEGDTVTEI